MQVFHPVGFFFCVWEIILLTAMATLTKPLRLAKHGKNLWHKRRLSEAFVEAQAALGERMYAVGIDDGELGARISALDEQLYVFGYRPPPSKNMGQIGIGDAKSCFWQDLGLAVADFLAMREMT